MLNPSDRNIQY